MSSIRLTMCSLVLAVLNFPALLAGDGFDAIWLRLGLVRFGFSGMKRGDALLHDQVQRYREMISTRNARC
jgi:hypothetical protein